MKLALLKKHEIREVPCEDGRLYEVPGGARYRSVTTRIGDYFGPQDWLEEWRRKIGAERADAISSRARRRGHSLHEACERYVLTGEKPSMPIVLADFLPMKKEIDEHLSLVGGVELPLYSHKLRTAGRTDLLGAWDGAPAIIDYKNTRYEGKKEASEIEGYFIQTSAYAMMAEELYGFPVRKIVILLVNGLNRVQTFVDSRWDSRVLEVFA